MDRSKAERIEETLTPSSGAVGVVGDQSTRFEARSKIIFFICTLRISSDSTEELKTRLKKVTNFSSGSLLWPQVHVKQMKKTICEGSF